MTTRYRVLPVVPTETELPERYTIEDVDYYDGWLFTQQIVADAFAMDARGWPGVVDVQVLTVELPDVEQFDNPVALLNHLNAEHTSYPDDDLDIDSLRALHAQSEHTGIEN